MSPKSKTLQKEGYLSNVGKGWYGGKSPGLAGFAVQCLEPLNARIGLLSLNPDFSASISFSTLITQLLPPPPLHILIPSTDAVDTSIKSQSLGLGHFLQVERRAAAHICTRNHQPVMLTQIHSLPVTGLLLVLDLLVLMLNQVQEMAGSLTEPVEHGNGDGVPLLLSCLYPMLLH
ncbi:hypothetical protein V6N11_078976 [Hibiscus sabdariffa]|uniref:Uncharacterized protein n=1 Tax=Hibiscus sabdariffa TaxID=183260 RepID=A0ABR2RU21_9ROSI